MPRRTSNGRSPESDSASAGPDAARGGASDQLARQEERTDAGDDNHSRERSEKSRDDGYEGFRRGDPATVAQVRGWIEAVVDLGNWGFPDPEGVVQEILLRLVRLVRSERFRRRASFKTFVYSVAKFTCVDLYRRRLRRPETPLGDVGPEPAAPVSSASLEAERRDLVRYVLQRLPSDCGRLWRLLYRDQLTAPEIGERLGLRAGAVRVRVHRCLRRAREIVRELDLEGWGVP